MTVFTEIASGLEFPEGPIALADGSVLVVELLGHRLSRVLPDGAIETVAEIPGGPNGAAIGPDGAVYVCNNGGWLQFVEVNGVRIMGPPDWSAYIGGRIQRVDPDRGTVTDLYTECDGRPLRSPNDLVMDGHGGFWFTDTGIRDPSTRMVDITGIYYAHTDGSAIRYEAVFTANTADTANPDLVSGAWVMRCEARTLDDIRALGGNDAADDRRFATAARVSETNLALYRSYVQPFVRAMVNPQMADWLRRMHPLRLQYEMFSDANPFMKQVAPAADKVRAERKPVDASNPFLAMQEAMSKQIVTALDAWRDATEKLSERAFLSIYGSPALQRAVGIDPESDERPRRAAKNPLHKQFVEQRIAELKSRMSEGGLREALIRATIYVGAARGSVDERGFESIRRIRLAKSDTSRLTLAQFKQLVREQFFMLLIDRDAALNAIPALLPDSAEERRKALDILREVINAAGDLTPEVRARLDQVSELFDPDRPKSNVKKMPAPEQARRSNRP